MKKIIVAITLSLSLGGCAGGVSPFTQIANPASPTTMYQAELVFDGSLKVFNELKGLCAARVLPSACRTYVIQGQGLIRQAAAADRAAYIFITNNPTLDATNVVQAFLGIVTDFKTNLSNLQALQQ